MVSINQIKLPEVPQDRRRKTFAIPLRQPRRQFFHNLFSILRPLPPGLNFLNNLPPDKPVRHHHIHVDRANHIPAHFLAKSKSHGQKDDPPPLTQTFENHFSRSSLPSIGRIMLPIKSFSSSSLPKHNTRHLSFFFRGSPIFLKSQ